MDKFDWKASESSPKDFLMLVVDGTFWNSKESFVSVPNGKTIYYGWGESVSSHVVGADLKPLPIKLNINFYSYNEDQFYHGEFQLPYEKIRTLFADGYFSPKENKMITYDTIVVGIVPGGSVSVWLEGIDRRIEVFFGQAKKVDGDWKDIIDNPNISRDEYIKKNIEGKLSSDAITFINKHGIPTGRWNNYHKARYMWKPVFTGMKLRDDWIELIKYYNGEEGYLNYPVDGDDAKQSLAIPKELHFVWSYSKDKNYSYELYFDEAEMFEVFDKFGSKGQPLKLEMKLIDSDKGKQFNVSISNETEGTYLKKFRLETYGAN